ncbi:MAG: MJ0042-type zinc finger domain-containing protein [Pseudomonadota bacterium]
MTYACPSCGTDYSRKLQSLAELPPKVRCHRCGTVWPPAVEAAPGDQVLPSEAAADVDPALDAAVAAIDQEPPTGEPAVPVAAPRVRERRLLHRLARPLAIAAVALVIAAGGGFAYAYREHLPTFGETSPTLHDVVPSWATADGARHLAVAAAVANPARVPATIDRVRVKFLSARGAWIGEVIVEVPETVVAPGASAPLSLSLDELPDGTVSLELSIVPASWQAS